MPKDSSPTGPDPELVSALYDAVADPEGLGPVMTRFAGAMACDAAYFKLVDQQAGKVLAAVGGGWPQGSDRDYLEHYFGSDVRVPRVGRTPRRTILDDDRLITLDEWRRSAFHHEWLPRYGLGPLLHINLAPSPRYCAIVTCAQVPQRGRFADGQRQQLAIYADRLVRAVDLAIRLDRLGGRAVLASAAFDRLTTAGAVLDPAGQLLFANAAAREILRAEDGLYLRHNNLFAADPNGALLLERGLRQITCPASNGGNGAEVGTFCVRRPSGKPAYRLEVQPLPTASGFRRENMGAAVLVMIDDPERRRPNRLQRLRQRYHLTPAEAEVALAVAAGTSLREYAEQRGVAVGTVRYQMKQILSKTGCRRQTELVLLITQHI